MISERLIKKHRAELKLLGQRLLKLRPSKKRIFHMGHWRKEAKCGTSACAIGHFPFLVPACTLKLRLEGKDADEDNALTYSPYYLHDWGFEAIAKYFGISEDCAIKLFDPSSYGTHLAQYTTSREVGERILQFIDNDYEFY